MALRGIKVVEMLGLAPAPFCGMLLADFGAAVTIVDKIEPQMLNVLGNGKKSVSLNLKSEKGKDIFRKLCKSSDVLIEPFRPGVMEKMNLGPNILMADNPKLIYARLTGYGQDGVMYKKAGHDINYVSLSGLLSLLGHKSTNPFPPINLAADFAGGGLMCAFGIIMALLERTKSNLGQIIDSSMVEGSAYLASWIFRTQDSNLWGKSRGQNILDGGTHFYNTYMTKDGKYIAVGAIEPQFYGELVKGLNLSDDGQFEDFENQQINFNELFLKRSQKEWCDIFDKYDACVTPVLSIDEASMHPHNVSRKTFVQSFDGQMVPSPAPHLSRTPASSVASQRPPHHGEHTLETLLSLKYSPTDIAKLHQDGVVFAHHNSHL